MKRYVCQHCSKTSLDRAGTDRATTSRGWDVSCGVNSVLMEVRDDELDDNLCIKRTGGVGASRVQRIPDGRDAEGR